MVGKSQPAISAIEKGKPASAEMVAAIAKQTQFAPWFFERGSLPDLPIGSLRYRKRAAARVRDDERIRAHVRQTVEVLDDLREKTPFVPVRVVPLTSDVHVDDDFLEDLVVRCREWLGVGPYDPIPNLTRAVERAGVAVIGSSQEIEKHEGAGYWPDFPSGRPIICLSRGRPGDKHRLSLAHELGHLVLHQLRNADDDLATMEAEAFRFAGALLIPSEAAYEHIQPPVTLQDLALVKARFGISIRALVRRSLDLGLISPDRRTSLEKQISARGWSREEPVHVEPERPQLVGAIVAGAMGTDNPAKLHLSLGLPPIAIRDMVA
jgi:Zn-dependent peptidase ImmA (M78 family)